MAFGWGRRIVLVCLGLVAWVFAANGAAHAAVQVEAGQRLATGGPYAWVRHPMYAFAGLLLTVLPLALGSWTTVVFGLAIWALMGVRALDEEAMLRQGLPGYADYAARVRWRMLPGVF